MKTILNIKYLAALVLVFGLINTSIAQKNYVLTEQGLVLKVTGTSSLHDWEMVSNNATGQATVTMEGAALKEISTLQFKMNVETLKSGKSGMDDNAYKALKSKDHPAISFQIKETKIMSAGTMQVIGTMNMAGVNQQVTFNGTYKADAQKINFVGKANFKLTDFKVDPPTAVFGTIKTGNDVALEVNITYQAK